MSIYLVFYPISLDGEGKIVEVDKKVWTQRGNTLGVLMWVSIHG